MPEEKRVPAPLESPEIILVEKDFAYVVWSKEEARRITAEHKIEFVIGNPDSDRLQETATEATIVLGGEYAQMMRDCDDVNYWKGFPHKCYNPKPPKTYLFCFAPDTKETLYGLLAYTDEQGLHRAFLFPSQAEGLRLARCQGWIPFETKKSISHLLEHGRPDLGLSATLPETSPIRTVELCTELATYLGDFYHEFMERLPRPPPRSQIETRYC